MEDLNNRKIHFIGIGGIGMSALAQIYLKNGIMVSGSDIKENNSVKLVKSLGGEFFLGHKGSNIKDDVTEIIYSTSIDEGNPEISLAKRLGLKIKHRSDLLLELSKKKTSVLVAGAHGKTTTSSMISQVLIDNDMDPTCCIGGEMNNFKTNAITGSGKYLVAELDESDGSFLKFEPDYAVLTNIDKEHLDYYKNFSNLIRLNKKFINQVNKRGALFAYGDDSNIKDIIKGYRKKLKTYGLGKANFCHADDIKLEGLKSTYVCFYGNKILGKVNLNVPGIHNVINSLAAVLVGMELGISFTKISRALANFNGAKRRFEIKHDKNGIMVVEDYAHHPTEISATINSGRLLNYNRIIGVFQPHRFSRTKFLAKEFGKSLSLLDKVILTDIYAASEKPIKNISINTIYDEVTKFDKSKDIVILSKELITGYLLKTLKRGDLVLVLGAGDVNSVAGELADKLG